jgi:acyl-CoA dehydrogenase
VSIELELLENTLRSIFTEHWTPVERLAAGDALPTALWTQLDGAGLTSLGAADSGAGLAELMVVAREVGRAAAPLPIVEMSGLATWLLASAGLEPIEGIITCAVNVRHDDLSVAPSGDGWSVSGTLHKVPWGHSSIAVAAIAQSDSGPHVVRLPVTDHVERGTNLAGEPRDTLHYTDIRLTNDAVAVATLNQQQFLHRGALLRAASMVGAMEALLTMSIAHASDRQQFGRAIISFSAVQDHLVLMAEEVAAARLATDAAAIDVRSVHGAVAKLTANDAAEVVAARSHQVHGAIGTTLEHSLHHFTKRLWSWQDEFGASDFWSEAVGSEILHRGVDQLWPAMSVALGGSGVTGVGTDRSERSRGGHGTRT